MGGDLTALAAGRTVELTLTASIVREADDRLVITELPPDVGAGHVARDLIDAIAAGELPAISDVADETSGLDGPSRIVLRVRAGTGPAALADVLRDRGGIRTTIEVAHGRPVGELVRDWIGMHGTARLEARLSLIEAAVARDRTVRATAPPPLAGRRAMSGYRPA